MGKNNELLILLVVAVAVCGVLFFHNSPMAPISPALPDPDGSVRTLKIYTTTWCFACKRLKASLDDPLVRDELAGWEVREVTEAPKDGSVKAYPTVIATRESMTGSVPLGKFEGYKSPAELKQWLAAFRIQRMGSLLRIDADTVTLLEPRPWPSEESDLNTISRAEFERRWSGPWYRMNR